MLFGWPRGEIALWRYSSGFRDIPKNKSPRVLGISKLGIFLFPEFRDCQILIPIPEAKSGYKF